MPGQPGYSEELLKSFNPLETSTGFLFAAIPRGRTFLEQKKKEKHRKAQLV